MTELKDPTPTPAPTRSPAPPPDDPDGPDPLASLHKMSTTAGITSQEYVAINIPSILALLVGLASVLAVLSPVLLILPVAGVIVGLIALAQIRASNGTQTGRGFAWLGIVLSVGIGAFVLVAAAVERNRTAADRAEIVRQIEQLGRHVAAKEYDAAYAMFSDRFHTRVDRARFDAVWDQVHGFQGFGKLHGMQWNQTDVLFEADPGSGTRVATAYAWLLFDKTGQERPRHPLTFRKAGDKWIIEDAPQIFPRDRDGARR